MTEAKDNGKARPFKMVVGVETDETGDNALAHAIELAQRFGGELHICHSSKSNTDNPEKIAALLDATLAKLQTWLADSVKEAGLTARCTLHPGLGEPAQVLEQLAVDVEADAIIVGTHGRQGMRKLVMGSVASKLVQSAPCPVVVAIPRQFEGLTKSPIVEPKGPEHHAYINHPHRYHYRRSVGLGVGSSINPSGIQSRGF